MPPGPEIAGHLPSLINSLTYKTIHVCRWNFGTTSLKSSIVYIELAMQAVAEISVKIPAPY